ncbi:membrane protein insertion efficiency factor YidD [Kitasatospora sp. NPDC054939]
MSYQHSSPGHQYPPPRPQRAWWWLPEQERRRRKEQRRAWEEYRRNKKKKNDNSDCGDCGDCGGCDACLITLIPAMVAAGLRFAAGSVLSGRRRAAGADPSAPVPDGFAAGALYGAVRYYRTEISPTRPACCPYTPSCSTYAVQALHRHGALRGARLTAGRLLRCRPGVARRGGPDPVPDRH